jgi:putative DNA primase/helicase
MTADARREAVAADLDQYYAGLWGLALIPVRQRDKIPLEKNWNAEAAKRWRNGVDRDAHLARAANWIGQGGNLGLALPVGVVALDADTPEAVGRLDAALPDAPMQETAKGAHFIVRVPENANIQASVGVEIGDIRVDVRVGGRSQIVVAPSVHASGALYTWKRELPADMSELPPCPPLILEAISRKQQRQGNGEATADEEIAEGQRNATLTSLAGTMRRRGMTAQAIEAALLVMNARRCQPPLADVEVRAIARSVARYEPAGEQGEHRGENFTDLGNARRLVRLHRQDLRFVHACEKWLLWDRRRWAIDADAEIMRRAKATVATIYEEASREEDPGIRKAIASHAQRSESEPRLRAMISLAASEPGIPIRPDQLDQDPWALNVLNGTVDLRTGKLRAHSRRDLITKLVPVTYCPSAESPRWREHLGRVIPDDEVRAFLQRAVGYSLTALTVEQVLFILWGSGANGKSITMETLLELLGDYACKTPSETLLARREGTIPNDVARLQGARFVSSVEMEEGRRLAESRIKELTGGDTVAARFMRAEFFEFRPVCKIWMATNHKPVVRGTDLAIWRRLRLIPFTVTIPEDEQDLYFLEKLRAELPGVLAWAVRGCLEWQRDGLNPPDAVLLATETYRVEQDTVGAFFDECCILAVGKWVFAGELYQAYGAWCEQNGEKPITRKALAARLVERGCESDRQGRGGKRGWRGISLRDGGGWRVVA